MNYIDCPIYVINLKENEKGLLRTLRELRKLDIFNNIQIMEAVNRKNAKLNAYKYITHEAYQNIEVKLKSTDILPTWGAVGCAISHKNCWEDMINKNFRIAIICEDDIKISNIEKFKYAYYNCLYKTLDYKTSIFTTFNSKSNNTYFDRITGCFTGASFYMINQTCARNLLKIFPIKQQFDIELSSRRYEIGIDIFNISSYVSAITNYEHQSSVQYYFIELHLLLKCLKNKLPTEIIERIYFFSLKKEDIKLTRMYSFYY